MNNNPLEGHSLQHNSLPKEWKEPKDLSINNIVGDIAKGVSTRHSLNLFCEFYAFVSMIKPLTIEEALVDEQWVMAMHDELNQFKRNEVWELVPRPSKTNIIGTKWVFKNKLDEHGLLTKNKARLIVKGYNQHKG